MKANEVIKGRYSMLSQGFEFDEIKIGEPPLALVRVDPTDKAEKKVDTLRLVKPLAALAIVSYDGSTDPSNGSGVVYGSGVLKLPGASALDGVLGTIPEPISLNEFTILPISRYWIDDPERLTGRAMFVYDLGGGTVSVLHYYFVLEDKEEIKFVATDARLLKASFNVQTGKFPDQSKTVQWGTQTRISGKPLKAPDLEADSPLVALRDRLLKGATT